MKVRLFFKVLMPHNDDQPSESESETWLDRRLDKTDEKIWQWILIGLIGLAGSLLGDALPPKTLGVLTATLFALWIISLFRVRRLRKRISSLGGRRPIEPDKTSEPTSPQQKSVSDLGQTLLCLMYDNWDRKEEWFPSELLKLVPGQPPEIEIGLELEDLVRVGLAGHNYDDPDHLYLPGQGAPEPGTYYIEDLGKQLVRDRRTDH